MPEYAGGQETIDASPRLDQFQRAAPQHQRLRLVGAGARPCRRYGAATPRRASSAAMVSPTGPAPMMRTGLSCANFGTPGWCWTGLLFNRTPRCVSVTGQVCSPSNRRCLAVGQHATGDHRHLRDALRHSFGTLGHRYRPIAPGGEDAGQPGAVRGSDVVGVVAYHHRVRRPPRRPAAASPADGPDPACAPGSCRRRRSPRTMAQADRRQQRAGRAPPACWCRPPAASPHPPAHRRVSGTPGNGWRRVGGVRHVVGGEIGDRRGRPASAARREGSLDQHRHAVADHRRGLGVGERLPGRAPASAGSAPLRCPVRNAPASRRGRAAGWDGSLCCTPKCELNRHDSGRL